MRKLIKARVMKAQIMPVTRALTRPMTLKTRPTSMSGTARESLLKLFFQTALGLATNLECKVFGGCGNGSPCQGHGQCNFATPNGGTGRAAG